MSLKCKDCKYYSEGFKDGGNRYCIGSPEDDEHSVVDESKIYFEIPSYSETGEVESWYRPDPDDDCVAWFIKDEPEKARRR